MFKRMVRSIFPAVGILMLILDSRTALLGAQSAVKLCINSVVPTLFPFLVMSAMLTSAINGANVRVLRLFNRLLGIPDGTEGIFLTGILGGYPTGAQAVYQCWKCGQLSQEDAKRMLAFCSNAGPAFIFGILGAKFTGSLIPWLLWAIHILSALSVALILPRNERVKCTISHAKTTSLTKSLKSSVLTMGYICGWIVIFRVILSFLDHWVLWLFPSETRVCIYGILELANGCCSADLVSSPGLRFILCSILLSFGGICVAMQTASVVGNLGTKDYLKGKLLQTMISFLTSAFVQWFAFPPTERAQISPYLIGINTMILLIYYIIRRKKEKKSSIPALIGV